MRRKDCSNTTPGSANATHMCTCRDKDRNGERKTEERGRETGTVTGFAKE
jgi:hypothetical protein